MQEILVLKYLVRFCGAPSEIAVADILMYPSFATDTDAHKRTHTHHYEYTILRYEHLLAKEPAYPRD